LKLKCILKKLWDYLSLKF